MTHNFWGIFTGACLTILTLMALYYATVVLLSHNPTYVDVLTFTILYTQHVLLSVYVIYEGRR